MAMSDQERDKLIESGREKEKGEITAKEMGAMGGTTTKNLVNAGKEAVKGNEDEVFIKKDNEATASDSASAVSDVSQASGGSHQSSHQGQQNKGQESK